MVLPDTLCITVAISVAEPQDEFCNMADVGVGPLQVGIIDVLLSVYLADLDSMVRSGRRRQRKRCPSQQGGL